MSEGMENSMENAKQNVNEHAMLRVEGVKKIYTRGLINRTPTFTLEADFTVETPRIVGWNWDVVVLYPDDEGQGTPATIAAVQERVRASKAVAASSAGTFWPPFPGGRRLQLVSPPRESLDRDDPHVPTMQCFQFGNKLIEQGSKAPLG